MTSWEPVQVGAATPRWRTAMIATTVMTPTSFKGESPIVSTTPFFETAHDNLVSCRPPTNSRHPSAFLSGSPERKATVHPAICEIAPFGHSDTHIGES